MDLGLGTYRRATELFLPLLGTALQTEPLLPQVPGVLAPSALLPQTQESWLPVPSSLRLRSPGSQCPPPSDPGSRTPAPPPSHQHLSPSLSTGLRAPPPGHTGPWLLLSNPPGVRPHLSLCFPLDQPPPPRAGPALAHPLASSTLRRAWHVARDLCLSLWVSISSPTVPASLSA